MVVDTQFSSVQPTQAACIVLVKLLVATWRKFQVVATIISQENPLGYGGMGAFSMLELRASCLRMKN